jgi:SAM-dependent methyltransferase
MDQDAARHYTGDAGRRYHDRRAQQRGTAEQAGRAVYFQGVSTEADVLLDFGCGTGGIAQALPARRRLGVEINETAGAEAATRLDEVHRSLAPVADASVDVAISFHALEHVSNPLEILADLHRVVRPGGRLRAIVPSESPLLLPRHRGWRADDPDHHLYAWTPLTFGNLVSTAGFEVDGARIQPWAGTSRVGRVLGWAPPLVSGWTLLKALRHGRFHVVVDAHR